VNAIFTVDVSYAAVERVGCQYKDEVTGVADAAEKIVMELAGTKFLDVQKYGQTTQLQVNFQQAAHTHAHTHTHTLSLCKPIIQNAFVNTR